MLAAIALVLLPYGIEHVSVLSASTALLIGGLVGIAVRWSVLEVDIDLQRIEELIERREDFHNA